jgi:hypothetical protein
MLGEAGAHLTPVVVDADRPTAQKTRWPGLPVGGAVRARSSIGVEAAASAGAPRGSSPDDVPTSRTTEPQGRLTVGSLWVGVRGAT